MNTKLSQQYRDLSQRFFQLARRSQVNATPGHWFEPASGKRWRATKAELREANRLHVKHRDIAGAPVDRARERDELLELEDALADEWTQLALESLGDDDEEEAAA